MAFSPRFSPDGQQVVLSLQQGGNANIYRLDLRTRQLTRLTDSPSIDTAPSYSPDGSADRLRVGSRRAAAALCHERGRRRRRSASASAAAATARRSGRRAATSSPSPSRRAASFKIGVMRPDGSGERILTEGFHNEGPTWSPNGRVADVLPRYRRRRAAARSSGRSTSPATTSRWCRRRALPRTRRGRRCSAEATTAVTSR